MPRRYRVSGRFTRRLKTAKYSNETYNFATDLNFATSNNTVWVPIIPPITQQGTRKVKKFEFNISSGPYTINGTGTAMPTFWALVYVPQGTEPNPISIGTDERVDWIFISTICVLTWLKISSVALMNDVSGLLRMRARL